MSTDSHPPKPPPDPLAVALANIDPAPHGFDWNALMFNAGRESKARALAFWRAAAALCAVVAACLFIALLARPVAIVERPVYLERPAPRVEVPAPTAPAPVLPQPPWNYDEPAAPGSAAKWFALRAELLANGLPEPEPKVDAPRRD
jgi:hypothetical protein